MENLQLHSFSFVVLILITMIIGVCVNLLYSMIFVVVVYLYCYVEYCENL